MLHTRLFRQLTITSVILLSSSVSSYATNKPVNSTTLNHSLHTVLNQHGYHCPGNDLLLKLADEAISSTPRVVGVSIAITHPKCGDFTYTYGESDISNHTPMSDKTKMPIASNTKPVLLVMALKLMEEYPEHFPAGLSTKLTEIRDQNNNPIFTADGKLILANGKELDLTDPDFFKFRTSYSYNCKKDSIYQCPDLAEIDLHHLLLESSGLADYIRETDLSHDNAPEMMKYALSKLLSPLADPGSQEVETDAQALKLIGLVKKANPDPIIPTQSHNTDASLLAIILERVSGQSLNELLEQKILHPLGLASDSMTFVTKPSGANETVAKRYALLNTDDEIETAIATGKTFPVLKPPLARKFKPSYLSKINRLVYNINDTQSAIDVLDLHAQGLFGFPGPAGIVAQPKAYIKFYQALASGKLLSAKSQALFDASFIARSSKNGDFNIAIGYESNELMQSTTTPNSPKYLRHGGLVPGGESIVLHNYATGMTMMIATNTSGSWQNLMPLLFVTPTPYFDKDVNWNLEMKYAAIFSGDK